MRPAGSLLFCALAAAAAVRAQAPPPDATSDLEGTAWQLVSFSDHELAPAERSHYTLLFASHGQLSARIDCNRGSGSWSSPGTGQLSFGEMATTRATCAPGSLYDQIIKHWTSVRSYAIRDGHLFLTLAGATYVYEPLPVTQDADSPKGKAPAGK